MLQIERGGDIGAPAVSVYAVKKKGQGNTRRRGTVRRKGKATDGKSSSESIHEEGDSKEGLIAHSGKPSVVAVVGARDAAKGTTTGVAHNEQVCVLHP